MHRSYIDSEFIKAQTVELTDRDEIHHIRDVLRMGKGDGILTFNGRGDEAACVITSVTAKKVSAEIKDVKHFKNQKPYRLKLACAIPKRSKFEDIIDKCTQLGVDEITPLITDHSDIKLDEKRAEKKQDRYLTVAVNAAKQCQRLWLPGVHPVTTLRELLHNKNSEGTYLIPCLQDPRQPLKDALTGRTGDITVIIGPEGDFSADELALALQSGCVPVSLGKTTLKVDTAAIAAIAYCQLYCSAHDR